MSVELATFLATLVAVVVGLVFCWFFYDPKRR